MVAPHVTTQLTRSLVRVPNSGVDKPNNVHILDLSRVSPVAALVQPIHDFPPNFFTSRRPMQTRPTPQLAEKGLPKPSRGSVSRLDPQSAAGNGLMQQQTATPVTSGLTLADSASLVELGPRTDFRRGTFPSLNPSSGNITSNNNPVALSPAGGRKRSLPPAYQDAAHISTTTEMRSSKVPRTATRKAGNHPQPAPSGRRATKEQLLREMQQLRAENAALRSMLNQRRLVNSGVTSGLLVH